MSFTWQRNKNIGLKWNPSLNPAPCPGKVGCDHVFSQTVAADCTTLSANTQNTLSFSWLSTSGFCSSWILKYRGFSFSLLCHFCFSFTTFPDSHLAPTVISDCSSRLLQVTSKKCANYSSLFFFLFFLSSRNCMDAYPTFLAVMWCAGVCLSQGNHLTMWRQQCVCSIAHTQTEPNSAMTSPFCMSLFIYLF